MINASSWTLQYLIAALLILLIGPVFSKLPAAQAVPLTPFGLNGSQTIRLLVEGSGLTILCLLSVRAYRLVPDNGRGYSFIRKLVLPLTILLVLIAADNTLRVAGLSLIDHIGSQRYALAYTAGITLTGLWVTTAWLLNFDALQRFFSVSAPETDGEESASSGKERRESHPDELNGETEAGTVALNAHN
ncbi:MAG: hypothetical protein OEV77_11340, partial [Nitrospira sp.]|nr:hypothetical protein [Nitrospira sp.]